MNIKRFFRAVIQICRTHPKLYIIALAIAATIAAIIASVVFIFAVKKQPVIAPMSSVVSKPALVSSEPVISEVEETEPEAEPQVVEYKNKKITVPKKVVADINSAEDPVSPIAATQPENQPESSADINTNCFESVSYGIDVSSHQGNIDWAKVKNAGVQFVMIRCGYRGYETGKIVVDAKFEYNILNAYKNGIKIGIYFYSTATNTSEALEEAAWVNLRLQEQRKKGIRIEYPIAYDFEEFNTHPTSRANGLSNTQVTDDAIAFLDYLKNAGYKVMHYSNKNWMKNYWEAARLKQYDFWLAHYCNATDYSGPYVMWQYSSKGSVDGISGNVDLDVSGIKGTEKGTASFAVCARDGVLAYSKPNSSDVVYTLNTGTVYDCLKTHETGWSEFYIDGKYVYVKDTDIETVVFSDYKAEYKVKSDKASYYTKCVDYQTNIKGEFEKDTKIQIIGKFKELWLKFLYENETYYIKFSDVEENITEPEDDNSSTGSSSDGDNSSSEDGDSSSQTDNSSDENTDTSSSQNNSE